MTRGDSLEGWEVNIRINSAQGGDSTPAYPGCVCSNWREMGPFWAWREGNGVPLYGFVLEGLHLYGCVFREFTTIWV